MNQQDLLKVAMGGPLDRACVRKVTFFKARNDCKIRTFLVSQQLYNKQLKQTNFLINSLTV